MYWLKNNFDERQQKEIELCQWYAANFAHGTVGHNEKMIIAKMADLLIKVEGILNEDNFDEVIADKLYHLFGVRNGL